MKSKLRAAFQSEMRKAKRAFAAETWDKSFYHLERAHILGQRYFITHVWTHLWMLMVACRRADWREIRGQIVRLVAVVPGYLFGWVPKGNTGGASVSALVPMPIPEDLEPLLRDYRVWLDVVGRLVLWSVAGFVVAGFFFAADVWARSGEGRTITSRHDGVCSRLLGVNGPEDIVVDSAADLAYAVGGDRRALRAGGSGRAHIWAFATDGGTTPLDVTPSAPEIFRSFGMDIHRDADGVVRLFVANRADAYHGIEVFRVDSDHALTHERTLTAPSIVNPNDVVAIDASSVYVTLDKEAPAGGLQEILEGVLERPTGRVALVTPAGATIVASGFLMANGIAFNSDRSQVYVAEMIGQSLSVFDADPGYGRLKLKKRIALQTHPDNITLADGGRVLVAAHPKLLTLALGYQRSESIQSPSEVIAVDAKDGRTSTVLVDTGELISGSSVAVQVPGTKRLLIGSAFAPYALVCDFLK